MNYDTFTIESESYRKAFWNTMMKGKGVPSLRNRNVRGDHFVTLVVQVPERMTEAQKEALRKFDDAMNGIAPEGEKHKKKGLFGKLEK